MASGGAHRLDGRPHGIGLEIAALALLALGGFAVPVVGWVAGVALLWSSRIWTVRDKLVGTFLPPLSLMAPLVAASLSITSDAGDPGTLESALWIVLLALLLALAIGSLMHLARALRR